MSYYKVYYGYKHWCIVIAETKYEAIERVFGKHYNVDRKNIKAVKMR